MVAGNRLTYTVVVTNTGPAHSTDTRVIDTLPFGTRLVSATASNGGICNSGILCLLGTLQVSEAVTVTIVVDVDPALRQGAVFTNTASAFSQEIQPPVPVSGSSGTTVAELADISVQKQDLPDPAGIGGTLRYQFRVANAGPSTAFNVRVTDTLDINTTFLQATLGYNCVEGPTGRITCVIPTLAAGTSQLIELNVQVAGGLADGQVLTNRVVVSSPAVDPNPFNNQDAITTTVRSGTDLAVAKAGQAQIKAGEYLTYTIVVNNLGPSPAVNTTVTDTLPAVLVTSTVSYTSSLGTCSLSGGQVVCALGTLAYPPQTSATITVSGRVTFTAVLGSVLENIVTAGSHTFDFNPNNNEARFDTLIVGESDLGIAKSRAERW